MACHIERLRRCRGLRRRRGAGKGAPAPRRRIRVAAIHGSQKIPLSKQTAAERKRQVRPHSHAEATARGSMSVVTPSDVRLFLLEYLRRKLEANGRGLSEDLPEDLPEDCDLLLSGVIDSLGLL